MKSILSRLNKDQRRWILVGLVVTLAVISIGQLLYPRDRLAPFMTIDSVAVGGWVRKDATWELDHKLSEQSMAISIKNTKQTYQTLKPGDIGLTILNKSRVDVAGYPLWARLIPTSVLWYHLVAPRDAPRYERNDAKLAEFVRTTLGDCRLAPKDAGVEFNNNDLQLIPASSGGTCDKNEMLGALRGVSPTISNPANIRIAVAIKEPKVTDDTAKELIRSLKEQSKKGILIKVNDETKIITQNELLPWLRFAAKNDTLDVSIDKDLSDKYFAKNVTPLVTVPAGTTRVSTRDFTELSRKTGKSGKTLAAEETRQSILAVLGGKSEEADAITQTAKPKVVYSRSYTKTSTGIAALLTHYDQDNAGVFGVSFVELGGAGRTAAYNQDRTFTTASTYKLFVAFSTLKLVDSGKYKWTDKIVDGRDLNTCFDDMIVKSDNTCAEALLEKLGRERLDSDLRSIGLKRSTFRAKNNQTTAAELASFLTKLQDRDLPIKSSSRDRLLSAMKRQQYRQGIPAGASGTVADKVGFLNGLLHDAAIVYSPKGTYVLVVLSDGSSWANIADITKKIESLR